MKHSKAQLKWHMSVLLTNGHKPEAQAFLGGIGYGPEELARGLALQTAWDEYEAGRLSLGTSQKQATQGETKASQQAGREIGYLRDVIRGEFANDPSLLTSLGIRPPRRKNGNGHGQDHDPDNGQTPEAEADPAATAEGQPVPETTAEAQPNESDQAEESSGSRGRRATSAAAQKLRRQQLFMAQVQAFPADLKVRLDKRGWSQDRLDTTSAMIQTVISANSLQQERMAVREAEVKRCQQAETDVREWYKQAVHFILVALKQLPLEQRTELRRLLGLVKIPRQK